MVPSVKHYYWIDIFKNVNICLIIPLGGIWKGFDEGKTWNTHPNVSCSNGSERGKTKWTQGQTQWVGKTQERRNRKLLADSISETFGL